jgi:glycosyltransferase involved in cell wall biosynthesis
VPVFLSLIERLARRHRFHVFVLDYYPEPCTYNLLGATVRDLGRPARIRATRRYQIAQRLRTAFRTGQRFDVVHAYWGMPAGVVAARVAPEFRYPLVLTLDSGELVRLDDIGYGLQRRWLDRRSIDHAIRISAAVTVPTHYMADLMKPGRTPAIIPVGVDTSLFPSASHAEGPPWRLLRVGSINRVKDYGTLLHALAAVVRRVGDVHLDVAGEDTLNGEMARLAARIGVDTHVTFHGALDIARVAALYGRAHLNVVSSRHESANVTLLEAAAAGVPTVGTRVGYLADLHPEAALAVPTSDPRALADAIVALLHDPRRRRDLASRASAFAHAHDADWTAGAFEQVYESVQNRNS